MKNKSKLITLLNKTAKEAEHNRKELFRLYEELKKAVEIEKEFDPGLFDKTMMQTEETLYNLMKFSEFIEYFHKKAVPLIAEFHNWFHMKE